jgi:hypothetical protein
MANENSQSFERFVLSVLQLEATQEKKRIEVFGDNDRGSFDAYAPDGIWGVDSPVLFIIKTKFSARDYKRIAEYKREGLTNKEYQNAYIDSSVFVITFEKENERDNNDLPFNYNIKIFGKEKIRDLVYKYPIQTYALLPSSYHSLWTRQKDEFRVIGYSTFFKNSQLQLDRLVEILQSDKSFTLVLGAGVSVEPGALTWSEIINMLRSELERREGIFVSSNLLNIIGDSNLISSRFFKSNFRSDRVYFEVLYNSIYTGETVYSSSYLIDYIAEIIARLNIRRNFSVMTYNFDNYLEQYLEKKHLSYKSVFASDKFTNGDLPIYHVHGFLPYEGLKPNLKDLYTRSIHFTEEDYNRLYNEPYKWEIVTQLRNFNESACLFIGCSFTDPNIRRLVTLSRDRTSEHFIILSRNSLDDKELLLAERSFQDTGVNVIWAQDYSDVKRIVRDITRSI